MKRWIKGVLWVLGAVILVGIVLFAMIYVSMLPTKGAPIGVYPSPRTALLVIDIQEDYTGPQAKKRYRDGDRIVAAANALLTQAQAKGIPVVYIRNVIDNPLIALMAGGVNAPGTPGIDMDRRLIQVAGARTFDKHRSDAFSNPALDAWLRQNQVNHVLLTGLDAAYCVNATTRGALNRGYQVTLYPEAIATESDKSMADLAESWKKAGARVKDGTAM